MRALLIDDHALFCEALGLLFDARFPQFELLQAHDLASGLRVLEAHVDIRLILVDLNLPDSSGVASLPRLRESAPHARLVVLSGDARPQTIEQAMSLGASGFVPKTARTDVLTQALQITLEGGVYMAQRPPDAQAAELAADPSSDPLDLLDRPLSARQWQVLQQLIEGKSNKLICRELGLSESTVKSHLDAIFRRLKVNNRTQAVTVAARLGLQKGH